MGIQLSLGSSGLSHSYKASLKIASRNIHTTIKQGFAGKIRGEAAKREALCGIFPCPTCPRNVGTIGKGVFAIDPSSRIDVRNDIGTYYYSIRP
jgi:hypothetical protein